MYLNLIVLDNLIGFKNTIVNSILFYSILFYSILFDLGYRWMDR